MEFNQTVTMTYNPDSLNTSLLTTQRLIEKISYSTAILEKLKNNAESYAYLKDLLIPLKELGTNVSSLIHYHQDILTNFTTIINYLIYGGNETAAIQSLATIKSDIRFGKTNLTIIHQRATTLGTNLSMGSIESLIKPIETLFDTYNIYTNTLVELYYNIEPHLLVLTEKPTVYLGETIHIFGYFIAQRTFVTNHTITNIKQYH